MGISNVVGVLVKVPNHCRLHLVGILGGLLDCTVPDFWNHYVTVVGDLAVISSSMSDDVIRVVVLGF